MTYACHVILQPVTSACGTEMAADVTTNLLPHLLQVPRPHPVVCKSPSLPPTFNVSALPPDAFIYDDGMARLVNCFYRAMLAQSAVMRLHVVGLSVCLSVCLSVTFRYRVQIGLNFSKIISQPNSLRPLLWLTPNMGDLVQREHPQN